MKQREKTEQKTISTILFEQLVRLDDRSIEPAALEREIRRGEAIYNLCQALTTERQLVFDLWKAKNAKRSENGGARAENAEPFPPGLTIDGCLNQEPPTPERDTAGSKPATPVKPGPTTKRKAVAPKPQPATEKPEKPAPPGLRRTTTPPKPTPLAEPGRVRVTAKAKQVPALTTTGKPEKPEAGRVQSHKAPEPARAVKATAPKPATNAGSIGATPAARPIDATPREPTTDRAGKLEAPPQPKKPKARPLELLRQKHMPQATQKRASRTRKPATREGRDRTPQDEPGPTKRPKQKRHAPQWRKPVVLPPTPKPEYTSTVDFSAKGPTQGLLQAIEVYGQTVKRRQPPPVGAGGK